MSVLTTAQTLVGAGGTPAKAATHATRFTPTERLGVAALIIVVLVGALLAVKGEKGFRSPFLGADKRVSTSKTIAFLWAMVVGWMLLALLLLAFDGDVEKNVQAFANMPDAYYLLLGGPFAALVAAKGIVTTRLANGTLQKSSAGDKIQVSDLVSNDAGETDLADLQYSLFNLVAVVFVVVLFTHHPQGGLPKIPEAVFGLTSAAALAYVGNKAVQRSTPQIASVSPSVARPGEEITITGSNFVPPGSGDDSPPTVTIGGKTVEPRDCQATTFKVTVPAGLAAGDVQVVVSATGDSAGANASATLTIETDEPVLRAVTPMRVRPRQQVTLFGRLLLDPTTNEPPTVLVNGVAARPATTPAPSNDRVVVIVPQAAVNGPVEATVQLQRSGTTSNTLTVHLVDRPVIATVDPHMLPHGKDVEITVDGEGFPMKRTGHDHDERAVRLGDKELQVTSWTATRITARVPAQMTVKEANKVIDLVVRDEVGGVAHADVHVV